MNPLPKLKVQHLQQKEAEMLQQFERDLVPDSSVKLWYTYVSN